jgi:hypothetical protein
MRCIPVLIFLPLAAVGAPARGSAQAGGVPAAPASPAPSSAPGPDGVMLVFGRFAD